MRDQQRDSRAGRSFSIQVMEYSREVCPFSNRKHTLRQFHRFRNRILDVLLPYGTVGPTGKRPILETYSRDEWYRRPKADFFVVDDDMYGLSVRVEASWTMAKPTLLEELATSLKQCQEWCVYLALVKGGLFVFHDQILFEGAFFAGCTSVEDIYHRCASAKDANLSTNGQDG